MWELIPLSRLSSNVHGAVRTTASHWLISGHLITRLTGVGSVRSGEVNCKTSCHVHMQVCVDACVLLWSKSRDLYMSSP